MNNANKNQITTNVVQQFSVRFSFTVSFTHDLFNIANPLLKDTVSEVGATKQHKIIVFVDDGVIRGLPDLPSRIERYAEHHHQHIHLVREVVKMPGGENLKSDQKYIDQMQSILCEQHIDRHSFVLGIGGGALLDAIGLVAATAHRGIRHIRIPTTVLAQNDSGVGVKNGVNQFGQKNYLGTFTPPFAVLNDYQFIKTLPRRDKISGMAEAVKVALIRDSEFFTWLESNTSQLANFDSEAMRYMIKRCAELHMNQIANGGDPFETGSARPLDFGHWIAHRLETITHHKLRHGEAVAIGIAIDSHYSVLSGLLEVGADDRIYNLLDSLGFNLWDLGLESKSDSNDWHIMKGITDFQEHLGGELTITLLTQIGIGIEVHEMNQTLILQSINWLKTKFNNRIALTAEK